MKERILGVVLAISLAAGLLAPASAEEQGAAADQFVAEGFRFLETPRPAGDKPFLDLDGNEVTFADFAGKVVLVNFWATWCAPCVVEMPSLQRLQAKLGGDDFQVVAISEDYKGEEKVPAFVAEHGLEELPIYLDQQNSVVKAFQVRGLPSTFLIDRQGRIIGGLAGSAEWDAPDALALIRAVIDAPAGVPESPATD